MTTKHIHWYKTTNGTAAFYNSQRPTDPPSRGELVVCLNYKDYNNGVPLLEAGVEPWFLTHEFNPINLVRFSNEPLWDNLAQEMVDYAASDTEYGFMDGNFYGVFWIEQNIELQTIVHVGLAYASQTNDLIPFRDMVEVLAKDESRHMLLTQQFSIPLHIEVKMPSI